MDLDKSFVTNFWVFIDINIYLFNINYEIYKFILDW
jgi:hypothetical protein